MSQENQAKPIDIVKTTETAASLWALWRRLKDRNCSDNELVVHFVKYVDPTATSEQVLASKEKSMGRVKERLLTEIRKAEKKAKKAIYGVQRSKKGYWLGGAKRHDVFRKRW
jgi:hypothetical protein